jgi:hypothetical protein
MAKLPQPVVIMHTGRHHQRKRRTKISQRTALILGAGASGYAAAPLVEQYPKIAIGLALMALAERYVRG